MAIHLAAIDPTAILSAKPSAPSACFRSSAANRSIEAINPFLDTYRTMCRAPGTRFSEDSGGHPASLVRYLRKCGRHILNLSLPVMTLTRHRPWDLPDHLRCSFKLYLPPIRTLLGLMIFSQLKP
jgi:hypothetical protein